MTHEASQWPAWTGEIDLGRLAEILGADGLWANREHARLIDRMCRDLANSPVSLIEYCQRGFPDRFGECVLKEERRRLSSEKLMRVPGIPTPHSAWQIAQLEAEQTDRLARSENSIQFAAAQRVARDVRLQFLKYENALADRARTLMARMDYHFVGVRGEMLSDRIAPRFAENAEFDWPRCRVVVAPAGQIILNGAIVWDHVYVSSPATLTAPAARRETKSPGHSEVMGSPSPPAASLPPPRKGGRKSTERDGMLAYLSEHYALGVPGHIKTKVLLHEMEEKGIPGSVKTLQRAMARHRDTLLRAR